MKKLLVLFLTTFLLLAFGGPAVDTASQPDTQPTMAAKSGGGGKCPKIYAPVTCDNGKTYPNQCVADKRGGKNCVPSGDL